ncbi:hypothetical protein BDQ17DRAFT_1361423 [Cyathus striatus]|nr:hypothetical protein BDQ17DRAFT_1361423 [Cyathus striatus]
MSDFQQATASTNNPPPFEAAAPIELHSSKDGKITHVSVYSSRAHVTRHFKFPIKFGHNQIIISGLSNVLDDASLRVEGKGAATIQDVAISRAPESTAAPNPRMDALVLEKHRKQDAIKRTEKAIDTHSKYLSTITAINVRHNDLPAIIKRYDEATAELDDNMIQLRSELEKLAQDINKEQLSTNPKRPTKTVTVGIFGETEGEIVDLTLHYAVHYASWTPVYDLRVDTNTKDKCIKLVYKASITQTTGEAWEDVPLTLETTLPSFDVNPPSLTPWKLSFHTPGSHGLVRSRTAQSSDDDKKFYEDEPRGRGRSSKPKAPMRGAVATVKNNPGHTHAVTTFEVPGLKTIPSDDTSHKVTIAELELNGELKWAVIQNNSEYPLLKGAANIYVDGSFVARSEIPYVSPRERFNCTLGVDPSIRVVYHPRDKIRSQTGFYSKSNNHTFTQRISLVNTKSCAVANIKVVDHIPVSEESTIAVKLLSPALSQIDPASEKNKVDMSKSVEVGRGIVAQWEQDDDDDIDKLGTDGKLSWVFSIPAQGKVDLMLSWEVVAPADKSVKGLQ